MPKNLVPLTIGAPGFFGLNTQQAGSILPMGWATKADNCIFDDVGRIAARKGHQQLNATVITNTPTIQAIHEYVDSSNNRINILAGDNKIYSEVAGVITDVSGTITTPTASDWQFANFNGLCVGYQEGHDPIVASSATAPVFSNSGGTQVQGSMVASAYGRLWTALDNTLYYSDLLINDFAGGSSGTFDLSKFWPAGMDKAVAVKDFNGLLVVFGEKSIIIYGNADDVANMAIIEGIEGIGCPFRDTVQSIGDDLVFCSQSGIRSLKRSIVEENMPLSDISKHVRDQLMTELDGESTPQQVKSVYSEREGFYLISLPVSGKSYYFDRRFTNEDGSWRATNWTYAPSALFYAQDTTTYVATDPGYLSTYTGFIDSANSIGLDGVTYTLDYEGVWNDFGEEPADFLKIPKRVSVLASGTAGGIVTFKWAFDYADVFNTRVLGFTGDQPSRFGISQYGIGRYSFTGTFERQPAQLAGSGQVIKVGLTTIIEDVSFAIQRIDLLAKVGRLAL